MLVNVFIFFFQPFFLVWKYSKRNLYKGKFIYQSLVVSVHRQLDRLVK